MKKIKKILCVALVLLLMVASAPVTDFDDLGFGLTANALSESGKCGDTVYWNYDDSTGTLVISGIGEMWSNNSYTDSPFYNSNIKSVIIENGITCISVYTFYGCKNLVSVIIPDSVITIAGYAFCNCINLSNINIPDSVVEIYINAFYNTAFYNDEENWIDDVLYIGKHLIKAKTTIDGEYSVKSGTLNIATCAFEGCNYLTSVSIPDSVKIINNLAFQSCKNILNIHLGGGVEYINCSAFKNCYSLESIYISDSVLNIDVGAFSNCNNLADVYYNGTKEHWKSINIEDSNTNLLYSNIHYNNDDTDTIETILESNCRNEGREKITCLHGNVYYNTIPKEKHVEKPLPSISATCTEDGIFGGTMCSKCNLVLDGDIIPALGHDWGTTKVVIKDSTCTEKGSKAIVCTREDCKAIKEGSVEEISRTGHCWSVYGDGKCTVCSAVCSHNQNPSVAIPEVPATCTTDGSKNGFKCADCGKIVIEPKKVVALGHDLEIVSGTVPTCTEASKNVIRRCKRKGCDYKEQINLEALGHDWGTTKVVIKDSTCTEKGSKAIVCTREDCKAIKEGTVEEIVFKAHDYEADVVVKEATCESVGEKASVCKNCSAKTNVEVIPALGHTYPDNWSTILEPDCQNKGASIKVCFGCNDVISQTLPKTGHVDLDGDSKCDTCEKTIAVVEPEKPSEPEKEPEAKPCDCNCHAGGIKAFFFNLVNFFAKIFDKNARVCACGKAH